MKPKTHFSDLEPREKQVFLAEARNALRPILTEWMVSEAGVKATLQLELIDRIQQPIMHHKIRFDSFGSDRLIEQQRLVLHIVQFQSEKSKGSIGDFVEIELSEEQLYIIIQRLKFTDKSCHVLLLQANIEQIMNIEAFRPHLPEKLRHVDLIDMTNRQETQSPARKKDLELPNDKGTFSNHA